MAITISGPKQSYTTSKAAVPLIWIKRRWVDEWKIEPELELVSARLHAGGEGASQVVIRRTYGRQLQPWRKAFETAKPRDLYGWWIKLAIGDAGEASKQGSNKVWDQFVGQIGAEARDIYGGQVEISPGLTTPSGTQEWTAYGGEQFLMRRTVDTSWWGQEIDLTGQGERPWQEWEMHWQPTLNRRDARNRLVGNRSRLKSMAEEYEPTYLFGGTDEWSNLEFLEYLLARYANLTDGPVWTVTGQVAPLADLYDAVDFGSTPSLLAMIRRLIPIERGLDFLVEAWEDGFTVRVFALCPTEIKVLDRTFPANDATTKLSADQGAEKVQVSIATSRTQRHDLIRVIGSRITVCCSLWGRTDDQVEAGIERELIAGWGDVEDSGASNGAAGIVTGVAFEAPFDEIPFVSIWTGQDCGVWLTEVTRAGFWWCNDHTAAVDINWQAGGPGVGYRGGTGSNLDSAIDQDKARKGEIFSQVYRRFVAPRSWTRRGGKTMPWPTPDGGLYRLAVDQYIRDLEGTDVTPDFPPWTSEGERFGIFQNLILSTLRHLPLVKGVDYSKASLPDWNPADQESDYLEPLAWVFELETERYIPASRAKIDVRALPDDIGVSLHAEPAHLLAREHFTDAMPSQEAPVYNYDELRVTLAFLADTRPTLEWEVDGEPEGSVKVIEVPEAEMWIAAPGTICGVDADGKLQYVGGSDKAGVLLRNDVGKLAEALAGAVARYYYDRCRAEIVLKGIYFPCADLLSQMLETVEAGGGTTPVRTPVTSVEFSSVNGVPQTVIRAGFAG